MHSPPLLEMIAKLVATPSVSAIDPRHDMGNRAVVDALAQWLEDEGFEVWLVPVPDDPERKVNVVAKKGQGEGGLVLSGHTDTVPFDEGRWRSDPFTLTERDGGLYGLGSADMKSFLAIAIDAARGLDAKTLKAPLFIVGTADEECGMDGARALVEAGLPGASRVVIGEPTGLRPVRLHKGCAMDYLDLTGSSGHSSDPRHGASALEGMHFAIGALLAARTRLAASHRHPALTPPEPTLNLGRIEGGDNPNRICAHCRLEYDLRVPPGVDLDAFRAELLAGVEEAIRGRGLKLDAGALVPPVPPFETAADAALVLALEGLSGHAAEGVSFATEAPFYTSLGLETVVLGPGDIAVAHQPDEFLPLAHLAPAKRILEGLITRFCVRGEA